MDTDLEIFTRREANGVLDETMHSQETQQLWGSSMATALMAAIGTSATSRDE
jgi:hypothetical protein